MEFRILGIIHYKKVVLFHSGVYQRDLSTIRQPTCLSKQSLINATAYIILLSVSDISYHCDSLDSFGRGRYPSHTACEYLRSVDMVWKWYCMDILDHLICFASPVLGLLTVQRYGNMRRDLI